MFKDNTIPSIKGDDESSVVMLRFAIEEYNGKESWVDYPEAKEERNPNVVTKEASKKGTEAAAYPEYEDFIFLPMDDLDKLEEILKVDDWVEFRLEGAISGWGRIRRVYYTEVLIHVGDDYAPVFADIRTIQRAVRFIDSAYIYETAKQLLRNLHNITKCSNPSEDYISHKEVTIQNAKKGDWILRDNSIWRKITSTTADCIYMEQGGVVGKAYAREHNYKVFVVEGDASDKEILKHLKAAMADENKISYKKIDNTLDLHIGDFVYASLYGLGDNDWFMITETSPKLQGSNSKIFGSVILGRSYISKAVEITRRIGTSTQNIEDFLYFEMKEGRL